MGHCCQQSHTKDTKLSEQLTLRIYQEMHDIRPERDTRRSSNSISTSSTFSGWVISTGWIGSTGTLRTDSAEAPNAMQVDINNIEIRKVDIINTPSGSYIN